MEAVKCMDRNNTKSMRKMKYMAEQFLKQLAYVVVGAFVATFYIWILDGEVSLSDRINQLPQFLTFMGIIGLLVYCTNNAVFFFNYHVSYGSTRKDAAISMIIIELMIVFTDYVLIIIANKGSEILFPLIELLFGLGTGFICGMLVNALGRKGYYIFIAICGFAGAMAAMHFDMPEVISAVSELKRYDIQILLGSIAYAVIGLTSFILATRKVSVTI